MPKPIPPATIENVFPPNQRGHDYFLNCSDHPFRFQSDRFELVNAWWLAEAALLSYADKDFALPRFGRECLRIEGPQPFSGPSTQCYVAHNDDFVIVSFRGTQVFKPGVHKELKDVLRDVLSDITRDAMFCLTDIGGNRSVHKGFNEALDEVWGDSVKPYLDQLKADKPGRTYWFTGHSLGAALATLAADRYEGAKGLYTFGSPRVGDSAFRDTFRVSTYRFVNNNDLVSRVPPAGRYEQFSLRPGTYKHVGDLKYIDSGGDDILDDPGKWERTVDEFRGVFGHIFNSLRRLKVDQLLELPSDRINDHGPLFYALHIWNNYEKSIGP